MSSTINPARPKWERLGTFLYRQFEASGGAPVQLNVGLALFTPGWEARNLAGLDAVTVANKANYLLNFQAPPEFTARVSAQRTVLKARLKGAKTLKLGLSSATDVNMNQIRTLLRDYFGQGQSSIFIDITSLPKAYIQSILGSIFVDGLFPHVIVGYAEGVYQPIAGDRNAELRAVDFESAKPLLGRAGPCREKRLFAFLGVERANCYALIEKVAPDYIHIFATRSERHPELHPENDLQVEKIRAEYADRVVQIDNVEAFSMKSFFDVIDMDLLRGGKDTANMLFAAGTKPHAVAAALLAAAHKDTLDLRYRRPASYPDREVAFGGRYFLFEMVDLRSERLPACDVW